MARISIDNGHKFCTPKKALQSLSMDTIVQYMDDDTREDVHADLAPCSDVEFLEEYLNRSKDDLIIG